MSKKTKKLKNRLKLAEYRLFRLERNLQELENHTYDAVGDDIERLHDQVDMWAETPLKDRVSGIETRECSAAIDQLRNQLEKDEFWTELEPLQELDWDNQTTAKAPEDSAFEQLLQGLSEVAKQDIRDQQVEPTESIPAWLLAKRSDGSFYINKYYVPEGEDLAIGEQLFDVNNLDQLEDLVQYIQDTLAVTGWDEGQL